MFFFSISVTSVLQVHCRKPESANFHYKSKMELLFQQDLFVTIVTNFDVKSTSFCNISKTKTSRVFQIKKYIYNWVLKILIYIKILILYRATVTRVNDTIDSCNALLSNWVSFPLIVVFTPYFGENDFFHEE